MKAKQGQFFRPRFRSEQKRCARVGHPRGAHDGAHRA
jgi:hypothetical protein